MFYHLAPPPFSMSILWELPHTKSICYVIVCGMSSKTFSSCFCKLLVLKHAYWASSLVIHTVRLFLNQGRGRNNSLSYSKDAHVWTIFPWDALLWVILQRQRWRLQSCVHLWESKPQWSHWHLLLNKHA